MSRLIGSYAHINISVAFNTTLSLILLYRNSRSRAALVLMIKVWFWFNYILVDNTTLMKPVHSQEQQQISSIQSGLLRCNSCSVEMKNKHNFVNHRCTITSVHSAVCLVLLRAHHKQLIGPRAVPAPAAELHYHTPPSFPRDFYNSISLATDPGGYLPSLASDSSLIWNRRTTLSPSCQVTGPVNVEPYLVYLNAHLLLWYT